MGLAFIISMVHRGIPTLLLLLKMSNDTEIFLGSLSDFISFFCFRYTVPQCLKIVPRYLLKSTYNT